jgi:type III secretion system FlhB-like substrate exporter
MLNFVIIPNKQNRLISKSISFLGNNLPINGKMPSYLCTGNLYYKFNTTKYETLPKIEPKWRELTLVITNGDKYYIGLQYHPCFAPIIIIKGSDVIKIRKYCAKNYIRIVNNNILAEYLFYFGEEDNIIPRKYYGEVAGIICKWTKKIISSTMVYIYKNMVVCLQQVNKIDNNKYEFLVVLKARNQQEYIIDICKRKNILIKYNKKITEYLFRSYEINDCFVNKSKNYCA